MSASTAAVSEQKATVPTPQVIAVANEAKFDKLDKLQPHERHYPSVVGGGVTAAVNVGLKGAGKHANERKCVGVSLEEKEKVKLEPDMEVTELLGSVTTHNCPGTRTSARVIQKMKQDQTRPTTPPHTERENKKEEKAVQKTPSQLRANKPSWTNLERNHFFDALNEFGKDFDALGNYINAKLKRKSATDIAFKTKDQVRQHYYQTYHKICKYLKFSDEVKKPAQELYALINYGEMRRKLQFVTDKHFMKLKNLVYQGHITVRCKGKNIRIKTPSCKALRRLNQLDDSLEDIRLPSKIEVIVSPANMAAFSRVQSIAQNPRARTTVPLHKKLVNFIKAFQYKWRSAEMKLAEEEVKLFPPMPAQLANEQMIPSGDTVQAQEKPVANPSYQDPEMCFLPKSGVTIHRPLLSITEYLSSVNICLTAYEERMGVKVRGETLCQDRPNNKRQRTESGSEKRSPETKKQKQVSSPPHEKLELEGISDIGTPVQESENVLIKCESSSDELSDELNELLSDTYNPLVKQLKEPDVMKSEPSTSSICSNTTTTTSMPASAAGSTTSVNASTAQHARTRRNANAKNSRTTLTFKPLISEDVVKRIRNGWTVSTAADITIGDLYVVLGQDSRLELEYYWTDNRTANANTVQCTTTTPNNVSGEAATPAPDPIALFTQKQNGMPYNPNECDDPQLLQTLSSSSLGNKLKHLLLIANLSERMRKRQCSCGHTCERNAARTRIERDLATKTFVSTKTFSSNSIGDGGSLFRQPVVPIRRPVFSMDPVKQLSAVTRQKLSRQVLVQRLLLPGGANHAYDVLDLKHFQNNMSEANRQELKLAPLSQNTLPTSQTNSKSGTNTTEIPSGSSSFTKALRAENLIDQTDDTTGSSHASAAVVHTVDTTASNTAVCLNENEVQSSKVQDITYSGLSTPTYQPNTDTDVNNMAHSEVESLTDFSMPSSFPDSAYDECSNTSGFNGVTPIHLLRESSSNSRWLEENLNDFSLTSLLGHLDEINASGDILDASSNLSVISESSVDYMHKFQEITALMQNQDKE